MATAKSTAMAVSVSVTAVSAKVSVTAMAVPWGSDVSATSAVSVIATAKAVSLSVTDVSARASVTALAVARGAAAICDVAVTATSVARGAYGNASVSGCDSVSGARGFGYESVLGILKPYTVYFSVKFRGAVSILHVFGPPCS